MSKVVGALVWRKRLEEPADEFEQRLYGTGCALAQRRLQLGECLLNRIEVGRVGGQIPQLGSDSVDCLCDPVNLVGAQVIHEYGVALLKSAREHLLDIGEE